MPLNQLYHRALCSSALSEPPELLHGALRDAGLHLLQRRLEICQRHIPHLPEGTGCLDGRLLGTKVYRICLVAFAKAIGWRPFCQVWILQEESLWQEVNSSKLDHVAFKQQSPTKRKTFYSSQQHPKAKTPKAPSPEKHRKKKKKHRTESPPPAHRSSTVPRWSGPRASWPPRASRPRGPSSCSPRCRGPTSGGLGRMAPSRGATGPFGVRLGWGKHQQVT